MIIMGFLNVVTFLLNLIFGTVFAQLEISDFSPEFNELLNNFILLLENGIDLFSFLLGPVASVLVAYIIMLQVIKGLWNLVWFVIRKIPMVNIRE